MTFNVQGIAEAPRVFRGASFRTDQTLGLWQKKKFRAFFEFTGNATLRFTATRDFILTLQDLHLDAGAVRLAIVAAPTPSGVWTPVPTKFCMNTIGGDSAGFTTVDTGGTITGGTSRDVLRANAGGGSGAGSPSPAGPRPLNANVFYMNIVVTGSTSGIYSIEWEELDTVGGILV